jgi:hypothetical protein
MEEDGEPLQERRRARKSSTIMSWYKEANQTSNDANGIADTVINFIQNHNEEYLGKEIKNLGTEMMKSNKSPMWWNLIFMNYMKKNGIDYSNDVHVHNVYSKFHDLLEHYEQVTQRRGLYSENRENWDQELDQYINNINLIWSNHNSNMALSKKPDLNVMNFKIPKWGSERAKNKIMSNPTLSENFANIEAEKMMFAGRAYGALNNDLNEIFYNEALRGNEFVRRVMVEILSIAGNIGYTIFSNEDGYYSMINMFPKLIKQEWFCNALFKFYCNNSIIEGGGSPLVMLEMIIKDKSQKMPKCMKKPIEEYLNNLTNYIMPDGEDDFLKGESLGYQKIRHIERAPWYKDWLEREGWDEDAWRRYNDKPFYYEKLMEYLDQYTMDITRFMKSKYGWRFIVPRIREVIRLSKNTNIPYKK